MRFAAQLRSPRPQRSQRSQRSGTRISAAASATLLTMAAGLLTACGSGHAPSSATAKDACAGRRGAPPAGTSTGFTALLLDRTSSASGEGAPDYVAELDHEVKDAIKRGDTIAVSGFDGSAGTVAWATVGTRFVGDSTGRTLDQSKSLHCVRQRITEAAQVPARVPGTDILGALAAAARRIDTAAPRARRVVVATDGLPTVGCASLLTSPISGDVAPVVAACRTAGELPDLTGAHVVMLGIGHPATDQPVPESTQIAWLTSLWSAMCGAATHEAVACTISSDGAASASEPENAPVGGATDPPVTFPAVTQATGDGGTVVVTLPERLTFATDSTDLLPTAQAAVRDAVSRVRQASGTVVKVIGHTDSRGTNSYNDLLSLGRAQRIADALRAQGVPVGEAVGLGKTRPSPQCGPERHGDGTADPVAMTCNRRVEVVIALHRSEG